MKADGIGPTRAIEWSMTIAKRNLTVIAGVTCGLVLALTLIPPVEQDPAYHAFADQRTFIGITNFWNVVSNIPFLLAALYGVRTFRANTASFSEPWERLAFGALLFGTAAVAFGSTYYHLHPDNQTLFWDRLPMTVVFMALVAMTLGERIDMRAGRRLLAPLILLGLGSVLCWRWTGDLRLYGLVQFGAMLLIPVLAVRFPPRYSGSESLWYLLIFYVAAKIAEAMDHQIGSVISTGGHPWKHLAAACAIFAYIHAMAQRRVLVGGRNTPVAVPAAPKAIQV